MDKFFKSYWFLVAIAVVMFLGAAALYTGAYEDQEITQKKVGSVLNTLDALYKANADPEQKREEILRDLLHEEHTQFYRAMVEHLAEALILAGIMIITVEGFTRTRASKEQEESTAEITSQIIEQANLVSENVWNAIFKRLVPDEIATEVKRILKSDVCRLKPSYTIVLSNHDYSDVPEGYVVVKRMMFYRLLNLTGGMVSNEIKLNTINTTVGEMSLTARDGSQVSLPRICKVTINKEEQSLAAEQKLNFSKSVDLPKMNDRSQAWEIYSEVEGLSLVTDRALYILGAPCDGLEVQVVNRMPDLLTVQDDEVYLTSGGDRLTLTTPQKWVCEGGLLTGTALSVPWRAVPSNLAVAIPEAKTSTEADPV